MANLLQSLQKTQTQRATQPVPGQAANLRRMLGAKSGKAGATSGPAQSNIQEQQALSDFSAAATQQQQQAQTAVMGQQQQQDAQTQRTAQQMQALQGQSADMQQKQAQALQQVSNNLDSLRKDLDSKRGIEALNQAIFTRRLSDEKYTTELARQGQIRRLENDQDFALEAAKSAFDNQMEIFNNEEEFVQALREDESSFQKRLAEMDYETALQVLNNQAEAANREAQIGAIGTLATTGILAGTTEFATAEEKKAAKEGNRPVVKQSLFERLTDG